MAGGGGAPSSLLGGRRGEYVFSRDNPFLGDPDAVAKGKDLFRCVRGGDILADSQGPTLILDANSVLTEATLVLAAEQ